MRLRGLFAAWLLSVVLISGCAPNVSDKPVGEYMWPEPPLQPRIKWLAQWSNQFDFGGPEGIAAIIGGSEPARLSRPNGVAADEAGNIYVADSDLNVIFVFDREEGALKLFGGGALIAPVGVAIDNSKKRVCITDSEVEGVICLDKKSGQAVLVVGKPGEYKNPSGIVIDELRDKIYVADTQNHMIKVFTRDGKPVSTIGEKGHGNGKLYYPTYLALDKEGRLYVSDSMNFRVQIFGPEGKFIKTFGKIGDAPGTFTRPKGIGVDSEGHIYVVDSSFNNFQIFDYDGNLLLWIGRGGSNPGEFSVPSGMYIDRNDRIYIADTFNRRVQVFQYLKQK